MEFFVTNPGPDSPVIPFQGFDISHAEPTRDYDAVEVFAIEGIAVVMNRFNAGPKELSEQSGEEKDSQS